RRAARDGDPAARGTRRRWRDGTADRCVRSYRRLGSERDDHRQAGRKRRREGTSEPRDDREVGCGRGSARRGAAQAGGTSVVSFQFHVLTFVSSTIAWI